MKGIFVNYLWTMLWIFWVMWFFLRKYKYRCILFMFDLRMINMSSECEYDWYWKISACSTEYEACDTFTSLTRQQTPYSGSTGWYFWCQSIHIQITYTSHLVTSIQTHFQSYTNVSWAKYIISWWCYYLKMSLWFLAVHINWNIKRI